MGRVPTVGSIITAAFHVKPRPPPPSYDPPQRHGLIIVQLVLESHAYAPSVTLPCGIRCSNGRCFMNDLRVRVLLNSRASWYASVTLLGDQWGGWGGAHGAYAFCPSTICCLSTSLEIYADDSKHSGDRLHYGVFRWGDNFFQKSANHHGRRL